MFEVPPRADENKTFSWTGGERADHRNRRCQMVTNQNQWTPRALLALVPTG